MLVFMFNPFKKVRSESCLQVQTCRITSCQRGQPRPIGFSILVNYVKFNIISSNNVSFHVQHIRSVRSTTACTHYWYAVIPSEALGIPQTEMCNHIKHIIFSPTVVLSEVEGPHK